MKRLIAAGALALSFLAGPVHAQALEPDLTLPLPESDETALPLDPATVQTFVDGVVEAYRREKGIAGVVVAVVARDGILMEKGYGIASLDPQKPVDPAKTLFRIASISKTFTYVMAMQLVSEGKLKLDAPADDYLPEELKFAGDGFPVPKLQDLMQHTAGFEDSAIGHLFTRKPFLSLEDYLVKYRPKRVRPPGAAAIYSNYSVALLGEIIARIDGRPFEDCVEARILAPLNLTGISFREPPDNAGGGTWSSTGFKREAGWFTAQPPLYAAQVGPAASASATADSMARYMRMLLNGGALDGATILDPKTFALMTSDSFRNAPEANAVAHGFLTAQTGNLRSYGHDGAAVYFYSSMAVWPEAGLALFVAVNTESGYALTNNLPRLFIEHFVPTARPTEPKAMQAPTTLGADIDGSYVIERRNSSTFEGFLQRLIDTTAIGVRPDGTVVISNADNSVRYVRESTDVLRALESDNRVRLLRSDNGQIAGYASAGGVNEGRKLAIWDSPLLFGTVMGALLGASLWCVAAFFVRLRYRAGGGQGFGERLSSAVQILTATLWLSATATLLVGLLPYAADEGAALFDYPGPVVPVAQMLMHAAAVGSVLTFIMVGPAWRGPTWRLRRLTFTVFAVLAVGGALLLWRWGALLTPLMLGV